MISDETVRKLLVQLLEKSRAGRVRWRCADDDGNHEAREFSVLFPESSIAIRLVTPIAERDYFRVGIRNDADVVVKRMDIAEDDPDWGLARDLFEEAGKHVLGWDHVLSDIEKAMNGGDMIGLAD